MSGFYPNIPIVKLLNDSAAVTALLGQWQGGPAIFSPRLPPGYNPTQQGTAISLFVRGGPVDLYTPVVQPSVQIVTWAQSPKLARAAMGAVTTVLHDLQDVVVSTVEGPARVMWGKLELVPQDIVDTDTGWFTVLAFFRFSMLLK